MPRDSQKFLGESLPGKSEWVIPGNAEVIVEAVHATFTDNGAAADWCPAVVYISDSDHKITTAMLPDVKVTAGGSAEASFFPGVKPGAAATASSLPVAFVDTTTQLSLTAWGGVYTAVTWTLFETNDASTFSWPSGADATKVHLATPGVYRCVYDYQVDGLNFPVAGSQILSTVDVTVAGSTIQNLSLDRTTGALYRGDPSVGTPYGATGERVFNITTAQDVRLFVAYTGAGTLKLDTIVAFIYKIGTQVL